MAKTTEQKIDELIEILRARIVTADDPKDISLFNVYEMGKSTDLLIELFERYFTDEELNYTMQSINLGLGELIRYVG